jgi:hypothetical protein
MKELVTITVPKKVEVDLTNGLSQTEVKSRLQPLANTIDTRGCAVKNCINIYQNPLQTYTDPDRLISTDPINSIVDDGASPSDDMFGNNELSDHVGEMLAENGQKHRSALLQRLNRERQELQQSPQGNGQAIDMNASSYTAATANETPYQPSPQAVAPDYAPPATTPSHETMPETDQMLDEALKNQTRAQHVSLDNLRTIRLGLSNSSPVNQRPRTPSQNLQPSPAETPKPKSTSTPDPVIMGYAKRNDLRVDVLAREVHRAKSPAEDKSNEVTISLH